MLKTQVAIRENIYAPHYAPQIPAEGRPKILLANTRYATSAGDFLAGSSSDRENGVSDHLAPIMCVRVVPREWQRAPLNRGEIFSYLKTIRL